MRCIFPAGLVVLVSVLLLPIVRADAQPKEADKQKRIAEIKSELAKLRARVALLEGELARLQTGPPLDLLALVDLKLDTVAGNVAGLRVRGRAIAHAERASEPDPRGEPGDEMIEAKAYVGHRIAEESAGSSFSVRKGPAER